MKIVEDVGVPLREPVYVELTCGTTGKGRMEEPENIVYVIAKHWYKPNNGL